MKMLRQTDPRWSAMKIGKSRYSIGHSGCVITALCNCANLNGYDWTPDDLNRAITAENGFTEDGLLIWSVAEKVLKCRIDHNYKGKFDFSEPKICYIGHYYSRTNNGKITGHFTNLLARGKDCDLYYDVYGDAYLWKLHREVDRYVKAEF